MATTIAQACSDAVQDAILDDHAVISREMVAKLHPLVVEKVREAFALHRHDDIEEAKLWATRELMRRATWLLTLTTRCGCSRVVESSEPVRQFVVPLREVRPLRFYEEGAPLDPMAKMPVRRFGLRDRDHQFRTATYEEVESG